LAALNVRQGWVPARAKRGRATIRGNDMLDGDLVIGGIRKRLTEQSPSYRPIAFVRAAAVERYCTGTCIDPHGPVQALHPKTEGEKDDPLETFEHGFLDPSKSRATREDRCYDPTRFRRINSLLDVDITKLNRTSHLTLWCSAAARSAGAGTPGSTAPLGI